MPRRSASAVVVLPSRAGSATVGPGRRRALAALHGAVERRVVAGVHHAVDDQADEHARRARRRRWWRIRGASRTARVDARRSRGAAGRRSGRSAKPLEHVRVLADVPRMKPLSSPRAPLRRRSRRAGPVSAAAAPAPPAPAPHAGAARPRRRRARGSRAVHVLLRRRVPRGRPGGRPVPGLRHRAELVAAPRHGP